MKYVTQSFTVIAMLSISSTSAVTFVNNHNERVILHDFMFTHNREIGLKPIIVQKNTTYQDLEIISCTADLDTQSVDLAALTPDCVVEFKELEVVVTYPLIR